LRVTLLNLPFRNISYNIRENKSWVDNICPYLIFSAGTKI